MATYYVAEGGTATDQAKENATSGTYPVGACLQQATTLRRLPQGIASCSPMRVG